MKEKKILFCGNFLLEYNMQRMAIEQISQGNMVFLPVNFPPFGQENVALIATEAHIRKMDLVDEIWFFIFSKDDYNPLVDPKRHIKLEYDAALLTNKPIKIIEI